METTLKEMQNKISMLETTKLELEKDLINLRDTLEAERKACSQGNQMISDLKGM